MTGASKILTVSYGTFSCTLEGFDEPFNTMKAIAEYFRDLAADDRYFGAEPPTPDAAMLHKIAEREIQRRVEAKVSDNGVLLRADDAPPPRVTMPAAPAPSLATVAEAAPAVESAAARLSRLRAAQTQILGQTQILAPAPALGDITNRFTDVEAYAEDQDAEPVMAVPAQPDVAQPAVAQPELATDPITPHGPVLETVLAEPVVALADAEPSAVAEIAPEPAAPAVMAPAEIAADLIAAPADPAPVATPEPVAEAFDEPAADAILSSLRETLAGLNLQDDQLASDMSDAAQDADLDLLPSDDILPEDQPEDLPADLADTLAETLPDTPDFDDMIDDYDQQDVPDLARLDDDIAADLARFDDYAELDSDDLAEPVVPVEQAAQVEPAAEPVAESAVAVAPATEPESEPEPASEPEVDVTPNAPIVAEKIQRARARVIKIRRLDKKPQAETLSPDAEADLQNTLAALEAELAPAVPPPPAPEPQVTRVEVLLDAELDIAAPTAPIPAPVEPDEKPADARIAATDEAAVDRLLARTNTQLEVPEVKRRRSAIAHLKAAVMATVADRKSDPSSVTRGAEVKMDPYRKDLDQAVRPSGAADRPAPLVLVSAQRIDRKRDAAADANRPVPQIVPTSAAPQHPAPRHPAAALPVRPRRVIPGGVAHVATPRPSGDRARDDASTEATEPMTDSMNNIFAGGTKQSFSEFAESLGAESLAELIEAAAAYCTLVLDQPSFTRPMLFQQMSMMPRLADLNPEDSLRGFGKLLRDGRIQKTVRGQFALSTTSPILTEAKRIAS
jgi:hypothetical protein